MASRRTFALAAGLVLALLFAHLPANAAELVSINAARTATGNGASFDAALSADGRFVAFASSATDLIASGTPGLSFVSKIFVRDLLTGTTVFASVNEPPHIGPASAPSLSADGRIVVYQRTTCPFPGICSTTDVFARDLALGVTTLVSVATGNIPAGGFLPIISPDGRYVVYNNGNICVRDLVNGTSQIVSINTSGTGGGNGGSRDPFISADGRFVAFTSEASDLVANDDNGVADVFLRDLVNGTTRMISVNATGTQGGNGSSSATGISADGRRVVFDSFANDLGPTDTNIDPDVYLRDLGTNSTLLVSVNSTETDSGSSVSRRSSITPNGRFVVFRSQAHDLAPEVPDSRYDIFIRDLETGVTRLVSEGGVNGGDDAEISLGRVVSDDGRFVVFLSPDPNLVTGVTYPCPFTPCEQTFLRDLQTGSLRLLSATPAGDMAGNGDDSEPFVTEISRDGRVVVFRTSATNLASVPDANDDFDLFAVGAPEGVPIAEVPTLGSTGLVLLALLVAGCGALSLRRL
jgi:Tol biopolymer transport system component